MKEQKAPNIQHKEKTALSEKTTPKNDSTAIKRREFTIIPH